MKREPVIAGMVGLDVAVAAVLSALVGLGVFDLTGEQVGQVVAAVVAVSGVVAGVLRARVTPTLTAAEDTLAAYVEGLYQPVPDDEGRVVE